VALNKIFNTAAPFGASDYVGRLRSGAQLQGRPVALSEWRFTTGDPEVAAALAGAYGGEPQPWDTNSEETLEVMSAINTVDIELLTVLSEFVLWGRGNKPIRSCNGTVQADDLRTTCVCPSDVREHKESARAGTACQPSIRATFRLRDLPDLGVFRFSSSSWQLAGEVNGIEESLLAVGAPAPATITLEQVAYTTKGGRNVEYTKPVIEVDTTGAKAAAA
jgi:hypothetical protein